MRLEEVKIRIAKAVPIPSPKIPKTRKGIPAMNSVPPTMPATTTAVPRSRPKRIKAITSVIPGTTSFAALLGSPWLAA